MTTVEMVAIGRLVCCAIATVGSVYLAYHGKEGWGWLIFAAIWLGGITASEKN